MQVLLAPGFVLEAMNRESVELSDVQNVVELLLAEVTLLAGLALSHYKQQVT